MKKEVKNTGKKSTSRDKAMDDQSESSGRGKVGITERES